MMIEPMAPRHIEAAARLHDASLTGLLTDLGFHATRAYYTGALKSPVAIAIVAIAGDTLQGFVLGSTDPSRMRADLVRANSIDVLVGLARGVVRRPRTLGFLLGSSAAPEATAYDPRRPELTYLAVSPESRGSGVGRPLVAAFGDALRKAGVQSYELSVDDNNETAIGFYERLGFKPVGRYREFGTFHRRYRLELTQD